MGTVLKQAAPIAIPLALGALTGGLAGGALLTGGGLGITAGGALAGAGIGAMVGSQVQEGRTAEAIGKYNQNVAEMQAKEIEAKTAFDQMRQAEEGARIMSTMEAGQAAAGGGMNLLAKAKQASELELQNLMIGRTGMIEAERARAEGRMAKWQGKQAKKQSYLRAGGTLLQGFGSMDFGGGTKLTQKEALRKAAGGKNLERTASTAMSWLD